MDKIKVLIVEDSITQAMQLQHILEKDGYDAIVVSDGNEALRAIKKSKPRIVLSDIVMPGMDGYELCRQIKSNESHGDISVILLTSLLQPQAVIWALQCGADKFFTKPYDENYLLSTIQSLNENPNIQDPPQKAINVFYRGETYFIDSTRSQIINLLLSTYEAAVNKNLQLIEAQDELERLNKSLEEIVDKRTEALRVEVNERKAAEAALRASSDEMKAISQQLWQAEKLATMGELAASIAHELNNPLATISLRLESLTTQTPEDDPRLRELKIIGHEAERMAKLVATLLQTSRRSQPQISTVNVCEEIDNTLELIHFHLHKYNVKVVREFAPGVPNIHADRQQLRQLFLNLFTNASDAMPDGGALTIRTYVQEAESGTTSNLQPATRNQFVVIEIADTGAGIPPEILPKVTESFFTTKPEGKGTGLGLSICRHVVQDHKGTFDITSSCEIPKGTTVRIVFPTSLTSAAYRSLREEKLR